MALTLTYDDAYLAPLIAAKEAWETRALADVADLGTFPDPWPDKLAVLRAYILCCLEAWPRRTTCSAPSSSSINRSSRRR